MMIHEDNVTLNDDMTLGDDMFTFLQVPRYYLKNCLSSSSNVWKPEKCLYRETLMVIKLFAFDVILKRIRRERSLKLIEIPSGDDS